jgi:hypothetical protein
VGTGEHPSTIFSRTHTIAEPETDIENLSTSQNVHIRIHLKPGSIAYLESLDAGGEDPIIEYFKLRSFVSHEVNCMNPLRENVVCYGSDYIQAVRDWFVVRKHHYELRVARQQLLLEMRILKLEQVIAYIEYSSRASMSKLPKAKMISLLESSKYVRIATQALKSPKEYPTDQLRQAILDSPKSSYDYLLTMGDVDKSRESLEKHTVKLGQFRAELASLVSRKEDFPGATQWLAELDRLEEHIIRESARGWLAPSAEEYVYPSDGDDTATPQASAGTKKKGQRSGRQEPGSTRPSRTQAKTPTRGRAPRK